MMRDMCNVSRVPFTAGKAKGGPGTCSEWFGFNDFTFFILAFTTTEYGRWAGEVFKGFYPPRLKRRAIKKTHLTGISNPKRKHPSM